MWIQSHAELRNHPKTRRLALALRIPEAHVIGLLHCLWWWCVDYAPDGDISRFDALDIASAAGWDGDPDAFYEAFVGSKFVDHDPLRIHDWDHYAGRSANNRELWRERKARSRERSQTSANESSHADVTRESRTSHADVTVASLGCHGGVSRESTACLGIRVDKSREEKKLHTLTEGESIHLARDPDPDTTAVPPSAGECVPPSAGVVGPDALNGKSHSNGSQPCGQQREWFELFWQRYPEARRRDKQSAAAEWARLAPDLETCRWMSAALKSESASDQWQTPTKIPFPATWLRKRRWEDYPRPTDRPEMARPTDVDPMYVPESEDQMRDYAKSVGLRWPGGDSLVEMSREQFQRATGLVMDAHVRWLRFATGKDPHDWDDGDGERS